MNEQIEILKEEKQITMNEIKRLKEELEALKLKLQQKKDEVANWDQKIADLDAQIDALYDEMEAIEREIAEKEAILRELEDRLNFLLDKPVERKVGNQIYIPVKGDEIDERLADYINTYGSPVPWKRISQGNYLYGSKKCNIKYMRQNLVIKVGGGTMIIEEFIAGYEDIELAKMAYLNPDQKTQESNIPLDRLQKMHLARGASPRAIGLNAPQSPMKKAVNAIKALQGMKVGESTHL